MENSDFVRPRPGRPMCRLRDSRRYTTDRLRQSSLNSLRKRDSQQALSLVSSKKRCRRSSEKLDRIHVQTMGIGKSAQKEQIPLLLLSSVNENADVEGDYLEMHPPTSLNTNTIAETDHIKNLQVGRRSNGRAWPSWALHSAFTRNFSSSQPYRVDNFVLPAQNPHYK
ncbi:hypothetical protein DdX_09345 [Ditylenchus destructor]|uniref:Uncharacterized protein n=1 Tax=Ditylenchus destructor TaxID=166010 RepID=A0AAD4R340_9BILA|nr:hypothetical protein DdX_09345 [Ditylenchus destructor]